MEHFLGLHPREAVEQAAALLGCDSISAEVAEYFDKHDKLSQLKENFFVPKVSDLPHCEFNFFQ